MIQSRIDDFLSRSINGVDVHSRSQAIELFSQDCPSVTLLLARRRNVSSSDCSEHHHHQSVAKKYRRIYAWPRPLYK
ncbi:hypothetical protein T05_4749 [Trichinella murrelli]|uniref:Uncharacterized protein n=1 Tax=Trichinella murrelli TaxID=144512 RepID=A0A0V0TJ73_9BILA|nr:hypothetical protein T05_4749 [Trichinella murrelli]